MRVSIEPLSRSHQAPLERFLAQRGQKPGVIAWKYFDDGFNRDRLRGVVLQQDGQVTGFVGIIPFRLATAEGTFESGWLCDWFCPETGVGLMLLRQATGMMKHLLAVAGNRFSRPVFETACQASAADAGVTHHLPLRLGAVLKKAARRIGLRRLGSVPLVQGIPLHRPRRTGQSDLVQTEAGVAKAIEPLLEARGKSGLRPCYGFTYVHWQVGRCPVLRTWTSYLRGQSETPAAAVFWRSVEAPDFWRMAFWARAGALGELEVVVREVIAQVYSAGGMMISAEVSHRDQQRLSLLAQLGFARRRVGDSLFVFTARGSGRPLDELEEMSYLDSDLAYRF